MTENDGEMIWELGNQFYEDYGKLVARYLLLIPEHLKEDLKEKIQEMSNVYSSSYEKYLNE